MLHMLNSSLIDMHFQMIKIRSDLDCTIHDNKECRNIIEHMLREGVKVDKQIRKIEKDTKKVGKELKSLEKMDKKRDKVVKVGKKAMKGEC